MPSERLPLEVVEIERDRVGERRERVRERVRKREPASMYSRRSRKRVSG